MQLIMLELIKAIANATLVSQGTDVCVKFINQKKVSNKEIDGLILALIAVALLNSSDSN